MKQRRLRDVIIVIGIVSCIGVVTATLLGRHGVWDLVVGFAVAASIGVPTLVLGFVEHLTKEVKIIWMLAVCAAAVVNVTVALATSAFLMVALPTLGLLFLVIVLIPEPLPGRCQKCDYDLRGNKSGRCPECGETLANSEEFLIDSQKIP